MPILFLAATARAATLCVLLLPVALLYSRAGAETLIGLIDFGLLIRSIAAREWAWLRTPAWCAALPFWAWLIFCSALTHAPGATVQAFLIGRFLLLGAALSCWLLRPNRSRLLLGASITAAAAWIGLECWQQYLFGANLFGDRRWSDGALTGPFRGPRAGPAFIFVFFPALLPAIMRVLGQAHVWWRRPAAITLIVVGVTTMILIGQRMPVLLMLLGLLISGLLIARARLPLLFAVIAGAVALASTPIISPPTFAKLYVHFMEQMGDFPRSAYGLLYTRALVIAGAHPWFGAGFDGFRHSCANPATFRTLFQLGPADGGRLDGCNIHPHNFYLEALTSAGVPGLILFGAMVITWIRLVGRGIGRRPPPIQVALLVTVMLGFWPLASTSALFSVPNIGWLFLVLGWGLAEAQARESAPAFGNPSFKAPLGRLRSPHPALIPLGLSAKPPPD